MAKIRRTWTLTTYLAFTSAFTWLTGATEPDIFELKSAFAKGIAGFELVGGSVRQDRFGVKHWLPVISPRQAGEFSLNHLYVDSFDGPRTNTRSFRILVRPAGAVRHRTWPNHLQSVTEVSVGDRVVLPIELVSNAVAPRFTVSRRPLPINRSEVSELEPHKKQSTHQPTVRNEAEDHVQFIRSRLNGSFLRSLHTRWSASVEIRIKKAGRFDIELPTLETDEKWNQGASTAAHYSFVVVGRDEPLTLLAKEMHWTSETRRGKSSTRNHYYLGYNTLRVGESITLSYAGRMTKPSEHSLQVKAPDLKITLLPFTGRSVGFHPSHLVNHWMGENAFHE